MTAQSPDLHPHPRPYYPYLIWILCVLFNFYLFLIQFSGYMLHTVLIKEHILHVKAGGMILDPFVFAIILLQFPIAYLIDRYGPRRMSSLAIFFCGIGGILFGISNSPFMILTSIFIMGIGGTVTMVNTLKLVSNCFLPHRFAFLAGLTASIGAIGGALSQPLTFHMIANLGWRTTMIDYGLIGIVYALLFFALVRDSSPDARYTVYEPSKRPLSHVLKKALKSSHNWLAALYFGLAISPWLTYNGLWHNPFFKSTYDIPFETTNFINFINLIAFAIGAPFFGWLSTRLKQRKIFMYVGAILSLILNLIVIYIPKIPFPLLLVLTSITGLAISTCILAYTVIHEKNIPLITASVIGMATISVSFFRLLGDFLTHLLLRQTLTGKTVERLAELTAADFQFALLPLPLFLILSLICLVFVKETNGKQNYAEV